MVARTIAEMYEEPVQALLTDTEMQQNSGVLLQDSFIVRCKEKLKNVVSQVQEVIFKEPPTSQAEAVADMAVSLMICALFDGAIQADQPLVEQLIKVITTPPVKRGAIMATFMNLFKETIVTRTSHRLIMVDFYSKPGIKTETGEYYAGADTDPEKYGYRWGTAEEVVLLNLVLVVSPVSTQQPSVPKPTTTDANKKSAKQTPVIQVTSYQQMTVQLVAKSSDPTSEVKILQEKLVQVEQAHQQSQAEVKKLQEEVCQMKEVLAKSPPSNTQVEHSKAVGNNQLQLYSEVSELTSAQHNANPVMKHLKKEAETEQRLQQLEQGMATLITNHSTAHSIAGRTPSGENKQNPKETQPLLSKEEGASSCWSCTIQ
ncbi:MAG: hypothetical protein HWD59_01775 [Coxiellaceae bacterium]|nr:MAG: hypothetical protein HWD59_01775 [Coxiellaceae bacterium]